MPTPVTTPPIIRLGSSMSSFLLLLAAVPSVPHVHSKNKKTIEGYLVLLQDGFFLMVGHRWDAFLFLKL